VAPVSTASSLVFLSTGIRSLFLRHTNFQGVNNMLCTRFPKQCPLAASFARLERFCRASFLARVPMNSNASEMNCAAPHVTRNHAFELTTMKEVFIARCCRKKEHTFLEPLVTQGAEDEVLEREITGLWTDHRSFNMSMLYRNRCFFLLRILSRNESRVMASSAETQFIWKGTKTCVSLTSSLL
jgi:hypothetical protein